ncbi:ComEA family DNA-binding protein [Arhodomonas sp. KWT2]|uniref:ComEA family DNA-binding protein n=1 Tax=Arhodomonas sp. KWT2 TaxID=3344194 RepID=UPI0035BF3102
MAGLLALQLALAAFALLARGAAAVPVLVREWRRRRQSARLERRAREIERGDRAAAEWTPAEAVAALVLIVAARGRGEQAGAAVARLAETLRRHANSAPLVGASDRLPGIAAALDGRRVAANRGTEDALALLVLVGRRLGVRLPAETVTGLLYEVDDLARENGPRTRLQDWMLEVFADAAGLHLVPQEEDQEQGQAQRRAETSGTTAYSESGDIDIDTADFDCLHAIPHIGPERAQAIIGRRPLEGIEQLTALGGISPKRLQRFGISA